jgi:hypothetical protein
MIGLSHLGCGHVAVLVVSGPASGQVWLDARGAGDGVRPIHDDFRSFFLAWLHTLAHQEWPRELVAPGRCALPTALSAYLTAVEHRLGVRPGELPDDATYQALSEIPDGGIATTHRGDSPFFAAGEPIDLCPTCERTVENLVPRGLRRAQIVAGLPPIPMRVSPVA